MLKCKSVTIQELQKGNKRMCLSALRVFGKCDECSVMKNYYTDKTRTKSKGVKICESAVISKERIAYLEEKGRVKLKIRALESELAKQKEKLD